MEVLKPGCNVITVKTVHENKSYKR